jgi:hypothetical protein
VKFLLIGITVILILYYLFGNKKNFSHNK